MSYQQEETIAKLLAEISSLQAIIDKDKELPHGPTRYKIQGDEVVWKICPAGSDAEGWAKDPYALMAELGKPDGYVAIPYEEKVDGDQS